ncbi:hypothetical protein GCM10023196_028890 [Actinoallomurus vinaceus]|uniref:Uncharacterized protein n=1 Tax=Actinoallomurus vinaceus TaxID=1080074 RepID=A0ABP8U8G2_9ACTN
MLRQVGVVFLPEMAAETPLGLLTRRDRAILGGVVQGQVDVVGFAAEFAEFDVDVGAHL